MKKSKKLSKLIALAVLLGGNIVACNSAWAQDYTITIGTGGAATSYPAGITGVTLGNSSSYIGITGGSTGSGDAITSITTADDISNTVWGIKTSTGTSSIAFTGGTIDVYSVSGKNYGMELFEDSASPGNATITGLQTIKAGFKSGSDSSGESIGIRAMKGVNDITFTGGTSSSITAKSTGNSAYGIAFGVSGKPATGTTTISGLGSVTVETTSNISNKQTAYGICVQNNNTGSGVTFTAEFVSDGGVINAYSANWTNYGILFGSQGDANAKSKVTNVKEIKVGVGTSGGTTSSTAYGISAKKGVNTVEFVSGSSITAKSEGHVYGVSLEGGTNTIGTIGHGLGSITAETTGSGKKAYGIYAKNVNAVGENPTFSVNMNNGSVSAYSASSSNYGISFETECTGKSSIIGVDTIKAGVATTGGSIGSSYAYGIQAEAGVNTVTFSGGTRSITAKSKGNNAAAYGVRIEGGTNTIGTTDNALKSIIVETKTGTADGIYATNGTNTITFIGSDSSISATSSSGGAHGISVGGGKTTVSKLGGITVSSSGTKSKIKLSGGTLNLVDSTIAATTDVNTLDVSGNATLNLSKGTGSGTTLSGGGKVAEGKTLTMSIDGSSKWDVDAAVTGNGAINVTNGGTLNFNADTSFNGIISGTGTTIVAANKTLTISAANLQTDITNDGTVKLTAGTLSNTITNNGIVNFDAGSGNTITASVNITGGTINVKSGMLQYTGSDAIGAVTVVKNGGKLDPAANLLNGDTTVESGGELYLSTGELLIDEIKGDGTTYLKASPTSVTKETLAVKKNATIAGTLDLSGGTLNMQGSTASVNSLTVGTFIGNGSIKFDATINGAASPMVAVDTINATTAGGTVTLASVNLTSGSTSTTDQWAVGYVVDNIDFINATTYNSLTISGTVTATTDGYKYEFTQGTNTGKLKVTKGYAGTLADIVQNKEVGSYKMGQIDTYSILAGYTTGENLGTFKGVAADADARTLTIYGNSHSFGGGTSYSGIGVRNVDTLTLTNISEISGWNTYAVDNEGTVNIGTTGTTALKSKLQGAGTYNLTGGTLKVADAANLAMTGADGLNNSGTVELGGDTASTLGAKITGGTLNINGNVTADASNIAADTNKVIGTLNVTSDGANDQLAKTISGTGVVNIQGTAYKDITLGAAISVAILNINTGTLNVQEKGAISSKVTNNASLLVSKGLISGEVTNKKDANMKAAPNVITGGVKNGGFLTLEGGYSEAVALGSGITNDGEDVGSTIVLNYVSSDKNIINNVYVGGIAGTGKIVFLPGHLSTTGTINGTINITENSSLDLNSAYSNATAIDNDGTLNVTAAHLGAAVDNAGVVNLGAGELAAGNTITGGTLNVTGAVTAGANDLASTGGITVKNGANLTLNGGTIQDAIGIENSGTGALTIAGTVANANSKTVTVAALAIASGSFTTEVGKLSVANGISNAGTLILTDTTSTALNNDLTGGGTLQIGDGTVAAQITSAKTIANAVDVKANATFDNTGAISGNVTNAGTLTSSIDNLTGTITNNGTFNVTGSLKKDISGTSGTTKIDGSLTANDSTARTISGTLNLNGGTLDMQGTTASVNSITVGTLSGTGNIKFDTIIDGGNTPTIDNIAAGSVATGTTLTLSNVNMTGTSTIEQWGLGSDSKKTVVLVTGSDLTNLTISGTVIATSDGYKYSFTGASEKGKVDITKDYGYSLHQIVTNYEDTSVIPTYYAGNITQYSLVDNYEATEELGKLTRVDPSMARTFTINGNNHEFAGGSHQGIAVNSGDTLNLTNIREISGWNNYAVYNAGTVNISTTGTTDLKSKLQGAGTYNLTEGTLKVEDASNLAMTGADGLNNSGTVELGGSTDSILGGKISGGTLNIVGKVSADATNIAADISNVTGGTLTVTSDGHNDSLVKPISGTGVVNIEGSKPITVLAAISVATLNINNGTLNVQPTGAISSKITNNAYLQANAGQISGEVTNRKDATMDAVPNVITGGVKNGGSLILNLNGGGTEAEPIALGCEINNDGENVGSTTVFHYVSSDKNITNNVYVGGMVMSMHGPIIIAGHLSTTGKINGTISITSNSSLDLNSAYSNTTAIVNEGILNVTAANLGAAVDNAGTVNLGAGELTEVITGGVLNINDNVTTVADNIASDTNLVAETKILTLTAGTLSKDVTNSGTIKTTGDVTISSKLNGGTVGKLVVESGTLQYTNANTGSITNNVEIKAGASMDPDAGVFATGTAVTNYGNLEITGGNLAASVTNYSTSNLEITEPVTVVEGGNLTFENGSTLKLEAEKYFAASESAATADKAAIQGINSATNITVDNGAKLALTGEIENGGYYVVLGGTAVSGLDAWQGLNLKELFPDDDAVTAYEVVKANGALSIMSIKTTKAEENINCFAGVQQGMISVNNQVADAVTDHLGLVGKGREEDGYKKDVWASYIRNKDDVRGMVTSSNQGSFDSDYRAQVNGTTVGADLFTSKKAIGGIAINYATGDTHGAGAGVGNAIAHINNKTKYYGVELYNRITNNHHAILMDIGYMHGNNEISVAEVKNWTGDADVNTITAGLRWERDIQLKGSKLVPFVGVRYIRLQSKDFTNTKGMAYSTNSQNLVQPKVGLGWTGEYYMSQSDWTFKPRIEIGYLWALGNREAETNAFINKYFVTNKFDVTDKNSYYAKLGMDFMCKNFVAGIGYSYMKGDAVRGNRWNVNLDYSF